MKKSFLFDYYRMTGIEWRLNIKSIILFIVSHQIRYVYWWRKEKEKHTVYRRFKLLRYSRKYGLEISSSATIGKGLYLGHPYNITVGANVQIGNNVNLHKGCTIGSENRGQRKGSPIIGDKVFVGINSTITGRIRIGNDVLIAPNTFVNFDVPDHSIVLGNPAIIHKKENATRDYIAHIV